MAGKILCGYCNHWPTSRKTSQPNEEEESTTKKKKRRKKKKQSLMRECEVTGREITTSDIACKYIKPRSNFFCYDYGYWVNFLNCINRHRYKNRKRYEKCQECRQWDKEVEPIIEKFALALPPKRIIKRRKKKRIIKRRQKPIKRIIKRRKKKRAIKRRDR